MKRKGFTLVEVLVVAVIIGILSTAAIPAMNGYITRTSDKVCEHTASMVLTSVVTFIQDKDPSFTLLDKSMYDGIDDLNAVLGNFGIQIPEGFTVQIFIDQNHIITVIVQDGAYLGEAEIGS